MGREHEVDDDGLDYPGIRAEGGMRMGKKRRGRTLTAKLITGFVLFGIIITGISIAIGVQAFRSYIIRQYNDTAYDIAETVQMLFRDGELLRYAKLVAGAGDEGEEERMDEVVNTQRYQEVLNQIDHLRVSMGANDIYVVYVDTAEMNGQGGKEADWAPLHYIFDTFHRREESCRLGDVGPFNADFTEEVNEQIRTGCRADSYYISKGSYGYNTSAVLPAVTGDREFPVLIGVEIPMSTLESAIFDLTLHTIGGIVAAMAVMILLFVYYLLRTVLHPIDLIAGETARFGDSGDRITGRLTEIRTGDELQGLAESVLKMERGILHYVENITKVTAEKERISTELNVAAEIQRSMLPCTFPAFPDRQEVDIYAAMDPAKEVGGDFYDFFLLDERHLAIVVADVSGKGVPAALFMMIGKTLIKDHTKPGRDLGEVFTEVNKLLCESNSGGLFITAFEGVLDLVTGEFRYVNAGHEIPFLCREGGVFEPCPVPPAFVLAGMDGMSYTGGSLSLMPGDRIFQYTDGVTEATNAGNELYGMERLGLVLAGNACCPPEELLTRVKEDIDAFVGGAPQFDDITMLCLDYKKRMQEEKLVENEGVL